ITIVTLTALLVRQSLDAEGAAQPEAALESLPVAGSAAGFARATEPDAIEFPRDLGPHDDYQTEWWHYTGNLATADGRPFGFQFTILRRALVPPGELAAGDSDWRNGQVYLAHFAVSDIGAGEFHAAERFSRVAAGLAGAQDDPYRVWLEDWSVEQIAPGQVRLRARTDEAALDLTLAETLPPVLHGDGGLSQKGP